MTRKRKIERGPSLQPPLVRMISCPLQYTLFLSRFDPAIDLALPHIRPGGKILRGSLDLNHLKEPDAHADHVPALLALEPSWLIRIFHVAVRGLGLDCLILSSLLIETR